MPRRWAQELTAEMIGLNPTIVKRFWAQVAEPNERGCRLWTGALRGKTGYGCMKVNKKVYDTHRLGFVIRFGTVSAGRVVRHSCDIRRCVEHLLIGSSADNHRDMVVRGRAVTPAQMSAKMKALGHRPPPPKRTLNPEQVRLVRMRVKAGDTHQSIADDFGICRQSITMIVGGRTYTDIASA
jgi:hypothetical protein